MTKENEIFTKLKTELEKRVDSPMPRLYFEKEDKLLEKMNRENKEFYEKVSVIQGKLYIPFTI